jgi:hypothetical protein
VAAGQISSDTVLPHKCGVPPGYGTPHLCGSEEVACTFRALSVRSKIATRQRFVSFFMQKARDSMDFFAAQKNTFFFKLLMV